MPAANQQIQQAVNYGFVTLANLSRAGYPDDHGDVARATAQVGGRQAAGRVSLCCLATACMLGAALLPYNR